MGLDVIDQGPDQILGPATARTHEDPVASPNLPENFLLGCKPIRIFPLDLIYFFTRIFLSHPFCSFGRSMKDLSGPNESPYNI
jgi:hypothetical protein